MNKDMPCVDIFAVKGDTLNSCVRIGAFFAEQCSVEITTFLPDNNDNYNDYNDDQYADVMEEEQANTVHRAIRTPRDSVAFDEEIGLPGMIKVKAIHMIDRNDMLVVGVYDEAPHDVSIVKYRFEVSTTGSLLMDPPPAAISWVISPVNIGVIRLGDEAITASSYTSGDGDQTISINFMYSDKTVLFNAQLMSTLTILDGNFGSFLSSGTLSTRSNYAGYKVSFFDETNFATRAYKVGADTDFTQNRYWYEKIEYQTYSDCEKRYLYDLEIINDLPSSNEGIKYSAVMQPYDMSYDPWLASSYNDGAETCASVVFAGADGEYITNYAYIGVLDMPLINEKNYYAKGYNYYSGEVVTDILANIKHTDVDDYDGGITFIRPEVYAKYDDWLLESRFGQIKEEKISCDVWSLNDEYKLHAFKYQQVDSIQEEIPGVPTGISKSSIFIYVVSAYSDGVSYMIVNIESKEYAIAKNMNGIADMTMAGNFIITANLTDNILTQQKIADII